MIDEYDTGENLMRHLKHTLDVGKKIRDSLPVIDKSIYKRGKILKYIEIKHHMNDIKHSIHIGSQVLAISVYVA